MLGLQPHNIEWFQELGVQIDATMHEQDAVADLQKSFRVFSVMLCQNWSNITLTRIMARVSAEM